MVFAPLRIQCAHGCQLHRVCTARERQGVKYELKHERYTEVFRGRLWIDGRTCDFQEDGTWQRVAVEVPVERVVEKTVEVSVEKIVERIVEKTVWEQERMADVVGALPATAPLQLPVVDESE